MPPIRVRVRVRVVQPQGHMPPIRVRVRVRVVQTQGHMPLLPSHLPRQHRSLIPQKHYCSAYNGTRTFDKPLKHDGKGSSG